MKRLSVATHYNLPQPSVGRSELKSRLLKLQMVVMVASIKYFTAVSGKVAGKRTKVYAKISKDSLVFQLINKF